MLITNHYLFQSFRLKRTYLEILKSWLLESNLITVEKQNKKKMKLSRDIAGFSAGDLPATYRF